MTDLTRINDERYVAIPCDERLQKISGIIKNYSKSREEGIFVFDKNDRSQMEVIAISAALIGLGPQAVSVAGNATSMEEHADYVEFDINDKKLKGWLWRSPFLEGDYVEVAAEWQDDHYEVFGVCRPSDRTIALYPHCSRGKIKHIRNAVKWWLISSCSILSLVLFQDCLSDGLQGAWASWNISLHEKWPKFWVMGTFAVLAVPVASMTRQWMPFVRVSERIFQTLQLPGASNIDLVKSSKNQRTVEDTGEFGSMYFRY